jgi:SAM-dependent methyltransferase
VHGSEELRLLEGRAQALPELERPRFMLVDDQDGARGLSSLLERILREENLRFDLVVGRDVLLREADPEELLGAVAGALRPGGRLALAETVPAAGSRLTDVLDLEAEEPGFVERLKAVEERIYRNPADPLTRRDPDRLLASIERAGFQQVRGQAQRMRLVRRVRQSDLERWLAAPGAVSAGTRTGSYGEQAAQSLADGEIERLRELCRRQLQDREVEWFRTVLIVSGRLEGPGGSATDR